MGQKRTYKQYSKEYKEEAVALVLEQGYSVPEAAKSLGIAWMEAGLTANFGCLFNRSPCSSAMQNYCLCSPFAIF